MQRPFLILETGQPLATLRKHGDFPHWIRVAAGLPRDAAVVCRVAADEALPRRQGFAGVLITGSGAMVTERLGWSERSADWLRDALQAGMPAFGICYGHQLLAHALGGEVGNNPAGREIGSVQVTLHDNAAQDPLLQGSPAAFRAQSSHLQSVLLPPSGAEVLASSAQDRCQTLRLAERAWGVQFHPEFSVAHMRGYVQARAATLLAEGSEPLAISRAVVAAPNARQLLRRFVRLANAS
jgi:GMP synthase (glutamine-hydrolysing)